MENCLNNLPQRLLACKSILSIRSICNNKMSSQSERGPETGSINKVNRPTIYI